MENGTGRMKIIVGVDGSEASVEAVRRAQGLAAALGAELEAWACWDLPEEYEGFYIRVGVDEIVRRTERNLAEAMTKAFGAELPQNVTPRIIRGSPRTALIDGSKEASMLVVGRRGKGRLAGLLLGSVSSACVAHAHCPVLVVHAPATDEKAG